MRNLESRLQALEQRQARKFEVAKSLSVRWVDWETGQTIAEQPARPLPGGYVDYREGLHGEAN